MGRFSSSDRVPAIGSLVGRFEFWPNCRLWRTPAITTASPVTVGPDQTVPADEDCVAEVTLDGTGSTDPEENELTYRWSWDDGGREAMGPDPTIDLSQGTHEITLVVHDGEFDSAPDTVVITVVDETSPVTELVGPTDMVLECAADTWEDPGDYEPDPV